MAAVNCVWRLDTQASGVTRNNKEAKDLQKRLDLRFDGADHELQCPWLASGHLWYSISLLKI